MNDEERRPAEDLRKKIERGEGLTNDEGRALLGLAVGQIIHQDILRKKRMTGRTTRMLKYAQDLETQGRAVYVIAANWTEAQRLRDLLPKETTIKVETPESPGNFDWATMRFHGAHPNCRVLVDPWTIECRYDVMLEELHRYDARP